MGGRGRGRGKMTFTMEQIGIAPGEAIPAPVLQPPLPYPLLEYYPALMEIEDVHRSQLAHKTAFLQHFSKFKSYLAPKFAVSTAYKVEDQQDSSSDVKLNFDWTRFPSELRPNSTKKRKSTAAISHVKEKVPRVKNINALLDELEKKEEVIVKKEVEDGEEEDQAEKDDEEEEMEDMDEEMDEGTDYNQNYFDNGEEYLDEDDDGDDGPIFS